MSIKPLDMQVAIGQLPQLAERQHQEQTLPGLQQQQHAAHLQKDGLKLQETVVQTAQEQAGNGIRDTLGEAGDRRRRKGRNPAKRDEDLPVAGFEGCARAEEDKGRIIDIRQ